MRTLLPLLILAALALPAAADPAATTTAPTTQAVPLPPLDPQWTALLSRLADPNPATRDTAQTELAALPNTDHSFLERLAAETSDPDLKTRLTARVAEMELELAIDPPSISIDVDNAAPSDIAAYMSKLSSTAIDVWLPPNSSTCTLKMKNAPFWDIFAAINQQMPLRFIEMGGKISLQPDSNPLIHYIRVKGFAIIPVSISRSAFVNFQEPGQTHPPEFNFTFSVVADPRINIAAASPPGVTRITDDAGNILYQGQHSSGETGERHGVYSANISFPVPKNVGKKIASLQGDIRLTIALEVQTVEVPDIEKAYAKPVVIGGKTVKFSTFKVHDNKIDFNTTLDEPRLARFLSLRSGSALTMSLVDANDKVIWSDDIHGSSGGSVGGEALAKPIKLRLTCPTRTKDVTIPFELKDIPLPAK